MTSDSTTTPPDGRDTGWHLAPEMPPAGQIVELRLRSGRTHFAQWSAGQKLWVSAQGSFPVADVEAWRRTSRLR